VRQIYPVDGPELEVITAATDGPLPAAVAGLAALYGDGTAGGSPDWPWIRANMVASADGASAVEGRSGGLGGAADRMVFSVLRSLADVVLVGAGTARAEKYKPARESQVWAPLRAGRARTPAIAVVSSSLDLSGCDVLLSGFPADAQTIVLTTARAVQASTSTGSTSTGSPGTGSTGRARVVVAGEQRVDVSQAVAALVSLGFRQILTEGGPHLLGQLAQAGLLDELCLTTSPVLAGGPAGRIVVGPPDPDHRDTSAGLVLAHVLTDAGFLLSRYVKGTPHGAARQG
jgi:riboflavin biosynthesis pyrimidine reductase